MRNDTGWALSVSNMIERKNDKLIREKKAVADCQILYPKRANDI